MNIPANHSSGTASFRVRLKPLSARPKVSVLITNFNYEEFLPRSIESALKQSWESIEVIVSDDGSKDRSCEVVQGYIDRGHPVALVRGQHLGMAGCLNGAYAASSGDIICLLDADDYFFPGKLEAVVTAFREGRDAGFCVHRTQRIDQKGRMGGAFPLLGRLPSGDCTYSTIHNSGILMGLPPTSALSIRREIGDVIFPIPEIYVGYAEQMIHRIAPLITSLCSIDEALSAWTLHRRNDQNASHVKTERLERELKFMEALWHGQQEFLLRHAPDLAGELEPLEKNYLYMKMRYILARLTGDKNAPANHSTLCSLPEFRKSAMGIFWRYSNRLPRAVFSRSIDFLETPGVLKQIFGRLLRRQNAEVCI